MTDTKTQTTKVTKILLPVICQNGHTATASFRFEKKGMEFVYEGVPREQDCECRKFAIGEGWACNGTPYVEIIDYD